MEITVTFPGNQKVAALAGGYEVVTDQPAEAGGDSSAPSPYLLFVSSVATCAGFYALKFCEARGLDPGSLGMTLSFKWTPEMKAAGEGPLFDLHITVPRDFDEKHLPALERSVSQCAVKKAIEAAPRFSVSITKG